jgi:hypothetical protein
MGQLQCLSCFIDRLCT